MNEQEKAAYIEELVAAVKETMLGKVGQMPTEWKGRQLRRYVAECFQREVYPLPQSEIKSFDIEVVVRNL